MIRFETFQAKPEADLAEHPYSTQSSTRTPTNPHTDGTMRVAGETNTREPAHTQKTTHPRAPPTPSHPTYPPKYTLQIASGAVDILLPPAENGKGALLMRMKKG